MPVATVQTFLRPDDNTTVTVQVDVSAGVAGFTVVGRYDGAGNLGAIVRAAITNSGFEWPATKRITVLLSPADLPKSGVHFDLPVAAAVLVASGQIDPIKESMAGELQLDGTVRNGTPTSITSLSDLKN
jgi:magnesium chelatase family protein